MNGYYYIFSCAFWVSVSELEERPSPQEYVFIFVSITDLSLLS